MDITCVYVCACVCVRACLCVCEWTPHECKSLVETCRNSFYIFNLVTIPNFLLLVDLIHWS